MLHFSLQIVSQFLSLAAAKENKIKIIKTNLVISKGTLRYELLTRLYSEFQENCRGKSVEDILSRTHLEDL